MKAENLEDVYELSPLQHGMLFHCLYAPNAGNYVEQLHFTVRGRLDPEATRRAWQTILERHPALRSSFHWEDVGKPVQAVHRHVELTVEEDDWRRLSAEEQAARFTTYLLDERGRGFDLETPPLVRLTTFQLSDDVFRLAWRFSHLVLDGWSFGLVIQEFLALYRKLVSGSTVELPPARPYRDYVAWWQRKAPDRVEGFWRSYLAGFSPPAPLDLGGSAPAGDSDGITHGYEELFLSGVAERLRAVSRERHLTLNTIVQGAWMLVLARCYGTTDITVGATMSHRPAELRGAESIVGPMIVTLPVRATVRSEYSTHAWLQDLQGSVLAAREHAAATLPTIQGWISEQRSAELFETIISFENVPIPDASVIADDLHLLEYGVDGRPQYPLSLIVLPGEDLPLRLVYDRRRFTGEQARQLLARLKAAVASIARDPDQRVLDCADLPQAERMMLLEYAGGTTSFRVDQPLHELVGDHSRRSPDAVSVIFDNEVLSYRELDERSNQLARHLHRHGVHRGDRVAICVERSTGMVVAMLAILKAGGAYVPLDPANPPQRLDFMLSDSGASVVLTEAKLCERFMDGPAVVSCLDRDAAVIGSESTERLNNSSDPSDPAYVMYTSGSTGTPKGVLLTHANVVRLMRAVRDDFALECTDVWTAFHSYAFDGSVWEIWGALTHGAALVVVPYWVSRSPDAFHELLARHGATVVTQSPSSFRQLMVADETSPAELSLRIVVLGGERVEPGTLRSWFERHDESSPRIINAYGPTESTVFVAYHQVSKEETAEAQAPSVIGRPIADTRLYLLDEHLSLVPLGTKGELHIAGPAVAHGYLGQVELNAERFVPDPFVPEGGSMYKSGDLARWLPNGELEYIGRADSQVKIRGHRVELGEIEVALQSHPQIRIAVARVVEESPGDQRLVAYFVPLSEGLDTVELRSLLRQQLPEYMVPSAVVSLDEIPLTVNNKLDVRRLPFLDGRREVSTELVPPRTETERRLAELLGTILNREHIGVNDNLVDLGLHSLLATKVVTRIRDALQAQVPLRVLFESPTVSALAHAIEGGSARASASNRPGGVDLASEVRLDDAIAPCRPWQPRGSSPTVLVTGATGFLGSFVVERLLQTTQAKIHCVVRARGLEEGRERLLRQLTSLGCPQDQVVDRVVAVVGNLSEPFLGMESARFLALAEEVDDIYHCGASVNLLYPYRRLRGSNVAGTKEVLRLATEGGTKRLLYVSSAGVFPPLSADALTTLTREVDLEEAPPPDLASGYAQSKWVAERLVAIARDRGLPVVIYRPGRVTGDSRTGYWRSQDATREMIRACVRLGLVPEFEGTVDMVPVDYVSSAIVTLAGHDDSVGNVFHLTNPRPVGFRDLADEMEGAGYPVRPVGVSEWYAELVRHSGTHQDEDWSLALSVFGEWVHNHRAGGRERTFDCSNTMALIGSEVRCPPIDRHLIETYIEHLLATDPVRNAAVSSRR